MQWIEQQAEQSSVARLQKELDTSPLLARLLVQKGFVDSREAQVFLKPRLKDLDDPFAIQYMDLAVSKILNTRDNQKKFCYWGITMWMGSVPP